MRAIFPSIPNFGFMKFKKISYGISIILVLFSLFAIAKYKFNFGIDFLGGITIDVRTEQVPDLAKMRSILSNLNIGEVILQNFGSDKDLSIRVAVNQEADLVKNVDLIKETLAKEFNYNFEYRKVDFVGPQVGSQMIQSGSIAMLLAWIAIMLYVWVRFEWHFGLGVLIALLHDVLIALGFMSLTQYDFNLSTVAAILTIIGYSVNDSVVIYDRIRENLRKYSNKSITELIDFSINETLSRTTITSFTTLIANLALIIFGGEAIESFSVLVFVGVFVGTYSSIFISAPILTLFKFTQFNKS